MGIMDRFRMDGRVALITGASRGLGKVMAGTLAEAGASVVAVSRSEADDGGGRGDRSGLRASVPGEGVRRHRPDQVRVLVQTTIDSFGKIDVLINNAGINIRGRIEDLSLEEFRQVQDTNVTSIWMLCREVAPHMKAAPLRAVVNVARCSR